MSITYTPATNFNAKDSLPTNDPDKVIKGSEFTAEFTAIQTAFGLAAPAASPTFTGTVTIASVDINGGNIDGTVIGAATPAAGSFTTGQFDTSLNVDGTVTADGLTVDGDVSLTASGTERFSINREVSPDIQYKIATNNYHLALEAVGASQGDIKFATGTSSASDRMLIASNGDLSLYEDTGTTAKFFWDASAESLGIGTGSPATNLDIAQFGGTPTIRISNVDGTFSAGQDIGKFEFYCGDQSTPGERVAAYILSQAAGVSGGGDLQFATSENAGTVTERMRIDSSGDMIMKGGRIKVRESDDGNDAVVISRDADEGYVNLYSLGSQTVEIRGNGNSYFNGGNVGIGTSSPTYALDVSTTASSIGGRITTNTSGSYLSFLDNGGLNGYVRVGAVDNNLVMLAGNAERMRIDSSGNVGIGTTSPATRLHLTGASTGVTVEGTARADLFLIDSGAPTDQKRKTIRSFDGDLIFGTENDAINDFAEAMRIDSSGNLLVGTTSAVNGDSANTKRVVGGNFATFFGSATIPASSTATVLTLPTNKAGMYLIAGQFGVQNNDVYGSMMIVVANGTDFRVALNSSGSSATLSMSGANVQIANALGVALDATATATFIGA